MKQFINNFKKQKTVGLLNISSLSLGTMVAIVIGLWAINELSFDKFHKNKDRIYRITTSVTINNSMAKSGSVQFPMGEHAKEELPAVEDMCRIFIFNFDVTIDNIVYPETRVIFTDPNFFTFFTFPLIQGDIDCLSAPDRVVISESAAIKYFPEQDPIGQSVSLQGTVLTVSGIMKDMPKNSSLQSDFILPFFGGFAMGNWFNGYNFTTFLLLQEGAAPNSIEKSLQEIVYRVSDYFKNVNTSYKLEPLSELHFGSGFSSDYVDIKGSKPLIMVLVLTALIILVISCINFTNLFISTSFVRAKIIGVKKAMGATDKVLIQEFYYETACYVFVSVIIGLLFALLVIPVFNNFAQSNLYIDFTSPLLYGFLSILIIVTILLAGSFPAFYMTRFNVIETLFSKFKGKEMSFFQKSLVIAQFAASIALLTVVFFMQKQVNYILSYDLGFNKEHVLYMKSRGSFEQNFNFLKGEFLNEPTITDITRKNTIQTNWIEGWGVKKVPFDNNEPVIIMEVCRVDPNYFDFFEMEIISGENPFIFESSDIMDVVINESAAKLLGYDNPVGRMITPDGSDHRFTIKGVVRNAHTKSLLQDVDPQVYIRLMAEGSNTVFFKINGNPQNAISLIGQKWEEREIGVPFDYNFLDDTYKQLYSSEMSAGKVFSFAMIITIIITVAGLFAMAYYATQRRVREVALRKVHGATEKDIFVLLNKDFLLWVAIAFIIACPIAYYGLYQWLGNFVVRTPLSVWVFLMVGVVVLLIALLTTSYQTWKAATRNPINGLKAE